MGIIYHEVWAHELIRVGVVGPESWVFFHSRKWKFRTWFIQSKKNNVIIDIHSRFHYRSFPMILFRSLTHELLIKIFWYRITMILSGGFKNFVLPTSAIDIKNALKDTSEIFWYVILSYVNSIGPNWLYAWTWCSYG